VALAANYNKIPWSTQLVVLSTIERLIRLADAAT